MAFGRTFAHLVLGLASSQVQMRLLELKNERERERERERENDDRVRDRSEAKLSPGPPGVKGREMHWTLGVTRSTRTSLSLPPNSLLHTAPVQTGERERKSTSYRQIGRQAGEAPAAGP